MRITLDTNHLKTVQEIIEFEAELSCEFVSAERGTLIVRTNTDLKYRDWASWCAAALDCGLLYGARIERE